MHSGQGTHPFTDESSLQFKIHHVLLKSKQKNIRRAGALAIRVAISQ
jgi:hypothetical protein